MKFSSLFYLITGLLFGYGIGQSLVGNHEAGVFAMLGVIAISLIESLRINKKRHTNQSNKLAKWNDLAEIKPLKSDWYLVASKDNEWRRDFWTGKKWLQHDGYNTYWADVTEVLQAPNPKKEYYHEH